jgi:predicted TIM-barrel fold metal-dependent hydrolase
MPPSDYFRRQMYACFWFEQEGVPQAIESLGADHVLFETDFPHPTCLYPSSLEYAAKTLADVDPAVQRKVLQDNSAELYRIPLRGT